MSHTECNGEDEFTKSLGTLCPGCGRTIPLGQNLCTTCGFNLEDIK
jgi:predicted amidophosphoribosyltransferase